MIHRIKRKRTKGWRMPDNTVNVCRPTKWGNPYVVGKDGDAAECVEKFRNDLYHPNSRLAFDIADLVELRGKNLACFCALGAPCHADVLLSIANTPRRTLRLTLKKQWFDLIASDIKKEEYRKIKPWITSRLHDKTYDVVEFVNGYGPQAPKIIVEYLGWGTGVGRSDWGATPGESTIIIRLGKILTA
jgi:hypothetical protein